MFKKFLLSIIAFNLFFPLLALAQEVEITEVADVRPVITSEGLIRTDRNIIFDASGSVFLEDEEAPIFTWDMGDGTQIQGQEVVHTYDDFGLYTVTLRVAQQDKIEYASKEILVFDKLVLLLTDAVESQEGVRNIKEDMVEEGTYLFIIDSYESTTAFTSEEALYAQLNDNVSVLNNADGIVVWSTRGSGVSALTRFVQQNVEQEGESPQNPFGNKTILVITKDNINTLSRILQGGYEIIQPKQMVVARDYELRNFLAAESDEEFVTELVQGLAEHAIINDETGKVGIWNSFSSLVNFMIAEGIPSNSIVLLLMLPVIVTIIALLKQVVGITTFGVYTPAIITLSFSALGLQFGLIILFIILITGAAMRKLLDRFNLLHIPRVSIILSMSALIILLTLAFGTYVNIGSIATVAVFPMLIMTTLAEKFVSALGGKGFWAALLLMLETTFVSLICYWVVEWQYLQNFILARPEIILLLIIFNYILGRWTGLRLMEYVRFRAVMKHTEE